MNGSTMIENNLGDHHRKFQGDGLLPQLGRKHLTTKLLEKNSNSIFKPNKLDQVVLGDSSIFYSNRKKERLE